MSVDTQIEITTESGQIAPLVTKTPVLNSGDIEAKRQEVLDYFHSSFTLYESLFECLVSDESYYSRANPLRHPLIFYYGHTSVFFINKLNVAKLIDERVNPKLESTLAIGVDEMSWDDLNDANYEWPTPAEVKAHRDGTRKIVDRFIRECDFSMPINWESPLWVILMGIEHERIHLETSSVLVRELPIHLVKPHPVWSRICTDIGQAPTNDLVHVAAGPVELGKSKSNELYGWDLEYGYSTSEVAPFRASRYLVSNQEFREFVDAGGYQNEEYWTSEGWHWVQYRDAEHPVFWEKSADGYRYRAMLEVIDMPWNWPAEINYLESKAFCNWMSSKTGSHIRMPTEAEWHKMRQPVDTDQPYWQKAPGNINLEDEMSPCPVDRHQFHDGLHDVIGNVWQWTETAIDGFDGFEVHPTYDDFSAPTFDGKHHIFKGGCWISTGNYAIKDARYAFRRHFFQHAGLRYIEAQPLPVADVNVYETDQMVSRYIEFHYGQPHLEVPSFPVACVGLMSQHFAGRTTERALDIGCATGRTSFELAKHFQQVEGVDFSVRLIETPSNLQRIGKQRYSILDEGQLHSYREVRLDQFPEYQEVQDRVSFLQGDACNLDAKYSGYDLVFAGNLLERLYDPAAFLDLIKARIRPGGLLVLASSYTWQEEYTPRDRWLGGFKAETGENFTSLDGIAQTLAPEFRQLGTAVDVPFFMRESRRKYQYGVSELTVWERPKDCETQA